MSTREVVLLGTASQVPTRERAHHGCFLRWDDEGLLLDPGEGTQRQMALAGLPASATTRVAITHLHGDHCLGLPGVVQRLSLDGVTRPVPVHFPASGQVFYDRLRHASLFHDTTDVHAAPVAGPGVVASGAFGTLEAVALDHGPRPTATGSSSPTAAACCPTGSQPAASPAPTSGGWCARAGSAGSGWRR